MKPITKPILGVDAAEQALINKLLDAHMPAEALAVWHGKPGIFLAHATSFIWQVLSELEPERLEVTLREIERVDEGQSAAMIRHQHAVCEWVRSERDLQADPAYHTVNDPEMLERAAKIAAERRQA